MGSIRQRSQGPAAQGAGECGKAGAAWAMDRVVVPRGGEPARNLYEIPDDSYHTFRRTAALEDYHPVPKSTVGNPTVPLLSHGCWADGDGPSRIVPGGSYGWDTSGCAYESARRGQKVFGMEAGGQCWIPNPPGTTVDDVRRRSKGRVPGDCADTGAAWSLNLYSIPDDSYAALRRRAGLSS